MRLIIPALAVLLAPCCSPQADKVAVPSSNAPESTPDNARNTDGMSAKNSSEHPPSFEIADEKARDPFAEGNPIVKGPQRLAPSKEELEELGEPVLKEPVPTVAGAMRFIYVSTFQKPFSIRVTKTGDEVLLRIVRMSGKGGYDWGKVEVRKTVTLTLHQWEELDRLAAVEGAREPSQLAKKEVRENFADVMSALDGSTWYLEVTDRKGHTVEGVPNPFMDDEEAERGKKEMNLDFRPFVAVCLKLFEFSGLDEGPVIETETGKNPFDN